MRNTISSKFLAVLSLLLFFAGRWLHLPDWVLPLSIGVLVLVLVLDLLGFCIALYQRQKEVQKGELEAAKGGPVPAKKNGIPWGKLWLIAFLLMIFSPILFTTHWIFLVILALFSLPFLIFMVFAVGLCSAVEERRQEKEKGELEDAQKY